MNENEREEINAKCEIQSPRASAMMGLNYAWGLCNIVCGWCDWGILIAEI